MNPSEKDELRSEYPAELVKSGERGKYARRYREASNVVVIDPDLVAAFPTSKSVNEALREYLATHGGKAG